MPTSSFLSRAGWLIQSVSASVVPLAHLLSARPPSIEVHLACHRIRGDLDAARGEQELAREHYLAALAIFSQLGERLYAEHAEYAERALARLDTP